MIAPAYFRVLRISLVGGREFNGQDTGKKTRVAIIKAMARRHWRGIEPIGKRFGPPAQWLTIVGDVKFTSPAKDAGSEFYVPYRQSTQADMVIAVRAAPDSPLLASGLRDAVRQTDSAQPVSKVTTMAQLLYYSSGTPRLAASLLVFLGALALLLTAAGIYGVVVFSVARRTREIGARIAIASGGDVLRMVVL